jgi:hypothetical protein
MSVLEYRSCDYNAKSLLVRLLLQHNTLGCLQCKLHAHCRVFIARQCAFRNSLRPVQQASSSVYIVNLLLRTYD